MKCTNCGNNNACYHYRYNINGKVTEAHLCPDCAAKAEGLPEGFKDFDSDAVFGNFDRMFDSMFDGFFTRPFGSLGAFAQPLLSIGPKAEEPQRVTPRRVNSADPELSKRREINALRNEMHEAADREDYEKAAEIRNKLRELEENDNK